MNERMPQGQPPEPHANLEILRGSMEVKKKMVKSLYSKSFDENDLYKLNEIFKDSFFEFLPELKRNGLDEEYEDFLQFVVSYDLKILREICDELDAAAGQGDIPKDQLESMKRAIKVLKENVVPRIENIAKLSRSPITNGYSKILKELQDAIVTAEFKIAYESI